MIHSWNICKMVCSLYYGSLWSLIARNVNLLSQSAKLTAGPVPEASEMGLGPVTSPIPLARRASGYL